MTSNTALNRVPASDPIDNSDYGYVVGFNRFDGTHDLTNVKKGWRRIAHGTSKTFEWTNSAGDTVHGIAGSKYSYSKGGSTVTADGTVDSKAGGHHRQVVGGDRYHEHGGDHNEAHGGDHIQAVAGSHTQMVGENLNVSVGSGSGSGHMTTKVHGDTNHHTTGTTTAKGDGDMLFESTGTITLKAGSSTITMKDGQIVIKADSIATDGKTLLGGTDSGSGSQLAVQSQDKDTRGDSTPSTASQKVFIVG